MKVARLNTAYMPRVLHFFNRRKGLGVQHGQGVGAEVSGEEFDGEELEEGIRRLQDCGCLLFRTEEGQFSE